MKRINRKEMKALINKGVRVDFEQTIKSFESGLYKVRAIAYNTNSIGSKEAFAFSEYTEKI